jgi:hypothetical protein
MQWVNKPFKHYSNQYCNKIVKNLKARAAVRKAVHRVYNKKRVPPTLATATTLLFLCYNHILVLLYTLCVTASPWYWELAHHWALYACVGAQ